MLVTNPFPPDPRPLKEAKILMKNGYSVEVIGWNRSSPDEVFPDEDTIEGIKVTRICRFGGLGKGFVSLFHFFKFYSVAYRTALRMAWKKPTVSRNVPPPSTSGPPYSVVYCHDLDTLIPGYCIARKLHAGLVVDQHEFYEGMMMRSNPILRTFFVFFLSRLKAFIYRKVGLVIYTNEKMEEYERKLRLRKGVDSMVVQNYPEIELYSSVKQNSNGTIVFGFFGNIREYEILRTIARLAEQSEHIRLKVAGTGPDADRIKDEFHRLTRASFFGKFHYTDIPTLYEEVNIVICLYTINPSTKHAFPVKFYEAYEIGIPVVTFAETALGAFVEQHDIGFVLRDENEIVPFITSLTSEKIEEKKSKIKDLKKTVRFHFESQGAEYAAKVKKVSA